MNKQLFLIIILLFSINSLIAQSNNECGCEWDGNVTPELTVPPCEYTDNRKDGSYRRFAAYACCLEKCKDNAEKKKALVQKNKELEAEKIRKQKEINNKNSQINTNQTTYNTNSQTLTPQNRLDEYQKITENHNANLRQQEAIDKAYQNDISNAISESFDNKGNFNAGVLINSLPTATTKIQAYSNLIMSGTAILGQILQSRTSNEELRQQEIANRRIQLKSGIGKYNSENKKTGHWTYFYMNTTAPKSSGSYKNGKKNGVWEFYANQEYTRAMDKIMTEIIIFNNGEIQQKYKAKNANYSITRETGLFSRKQKFVKQKGNYLINSNNEKVKYGLWEEYNDFGVNMSTGYYNIKGEETGLWSFGYEFQKNGVYHSRVYNLHFKRHYSNGIISGNETSHFRNGKIEQEIYWEDNQILSRKIFDKKGKLIKNEKNEKTKKENFIKLDISTFEKYGEVTKNYENYLDIEKLGIHSVNIDSTLFKVINNFSELKSIKINGSGGFILGSVERIKLNYFHNNITKIKKLESLDLSYSDVTNLPSSIQNLTKLKAIEMYYNKLTQFPVDLCKISSLEIIDFSHNKIKELPESIKNLSNLKQLKLGDNNLTALPKGFGESLKLEVLILNRNQINELPQNFGNMPKLEILMLQGNNLKTLPENFINMTELTLLCIDKNLKVKAKKILKRMKENNKKLEIRYQ